MLSVIIAIQFNFISHFRLVFCIFSSSSCLQCLGIPFWFYDATYGRSRYSVFCIKPPILLQNIRRIYSSETHAFSSQSVPKLLFCFSFRLCQSWAVLKIPTVTSSRPQKSSGSTMLMTKIPFLRLRRLRHLHPSRLLSTATFLLVHQSPLLLTRLLGPVALLARPTHLKG